MGLKTQRRLASKIMKIGQNRVWIDPDRTEDVESVITREEIKKMIHDGIIKSSPEKGISKSRNRSVHEKKKIGRRRGLGSREGKMTSRTPRKRSWISRIRALRKRLRILRTNRSITKKNYRDLYLLSKGNTFESVSELNQYLSSRKLLRRS